MDRRSRKRFDVDASVKYSWRDDQQIECTGQGVTRDVSECGLFVSTELSPSVGTLVEVEVSFSFRDDSQVQMRATGLTVRVEKDGDNKIRGFAASTSKLWVQNSATAPLRSGFATEGAD
jgi:hypothetical protein